jgi:opacity protein-like surface antigen
MHKKPLAIAFAALLAAGLAHAEAEADPGHYYLGVHTGGSSAGSADFNFGGSDQGAQFKRDNLNQKSVKFGHKKDDGGGRAEIEYIEQKNEVSGFAGGPGSGSLKSRSVMINGLWDFKLGPVVTPFAGGGLGRTEVRATGLGNATSQVDGSDQKWALQLIVGVGFKLAPQLGVHLDLRHQRTIGAPTLPFSTTSCTTSPVAAPICTTTTGTASAGQAYTTNTLGVGLDWSF